MPPGIIKRLAAFVGAKSAAAVLPHITKRPQLLAPLLDRLRATALRNVKEKGAFFKKEWNEQGRVLQGGINQPGMKGGPH